MATLIHEPKPPPYSYSPSYPFSNGIMADMTQQTNESNNSYPSEKPTNVIQQISEQNQYGDGRYSNRRAPRPKQPKSLLECPHCSRELNSIEALKQHQLAKGHLFDCLECSASFHTADGLLQHQEAKNHDESHYTCAFCNAVFNSPHALQQHHSAKHHTNIPDEEEEDDTTRAILGGVRLIASLYKALTKK
ncbi:unnamed protein product [Didymodactylos carnosus]|uniref:C2H2-type domain-containing protein n=1 Tax=Didymodactylos carnosus TaxID=1234261 RepID=A0A814W173_9BILA|nr:unnamed protein product [Didymodactylos carnosus]CAF1195417.1 unnamed protein product [Didymodactylos carnosus]CAF3771805.1 unnamed protein product [Didymodactylos carnosus]CAF3959850.1 unnamed protein product [Didymodactylos carnosus]